MRWTRRLALDSIGERGREELLGCALKWAIVLVVLLLVGAGCDGGSSTPQTVRDAGWTDTVETTYDEKAIECAMAGTGSILGTWIVCVET